MSSTPRYYAAACQLDLPNPKHRSEIPGRVKKMLDMVEYAVTGYQPFHDVRLVVFPELTLAGYPPKDLLLQRKTAEQQQLMIAKPAGHDENAIPVLSYNIVIEKVQALP